MNCGQGYGIMGKLLFHLYLLWAVWQDCREMQVVRYSHILGALAVFLQIFRRSAYICMNVPKYILYVSAMLLVQAVQYKCKCYGLADAIVFFLCGSFFLSTKDRGDAFLLYFVLQALSGILFILHQCLKRNVKGLCLKHSVPYIPYICVAFILTNGVLWKYI